MTVPATRAGQRHERTRRRWHRVVGFGAALLAAGLLGGVVAAALDSDGSPTVVRRGSAGGGSCTVSKVAANGLPSVVMVEVQGGRSGTGSGEVIRADGDILTNNHVISAAAGGAGSIAVQFSDGSTADARLVGRDPSTDLAVVKVDTTAKLSVIRFGQSAALTVGEPVVALGAPMGYPNTVTSGIVSALDRSVQVPADNGGTALLVAAIQTDAAINPGNSGGALVDCDARLVGVPTAGAVVPSASGAASAGNIGIGFAIPADFARKISDEIISTGKATHSSFGVQVAPVVPSAATRSGTTAGLLVTAVSPRGPADAAGIRAEDVITEIDGEAAQSAEQLQALTLTKRAGDKVAITYERNGRSNTTSVTLTDATTG